MDFKVLIADSAIADLKEIVEFVAGDNPEAAICLGITCTTTSVGFTNGAGDASNGSRRFRSRLEPG